MSLIPVLKKLEQARKELRRSIERIAIIFVDMAESTIYKDEKGIELGVEKVIRFTLCFSRERNRVRAHGGSLSSAVPGWVAKTV